MKKNSYFMLWSCFSIFVCLINKNFKWTKPTLNAYKLNNYIIYFSFYCFTNYSFVDHKQNKVYSSDSICVNVCVCWYIYIEIVNLKWINIYTCKKYHKYNSYIFDYFWWKMLKINYSILNLLFGSCVMNNPIIETNLLVVSVL